MQLVDFTTLTAACAELRSEWIPARLEQVYQRDRFTIALFLRTLKRRGWLTISWHPQAARLCLGDPPPRTPDTFTFSDQLRHQLTGWALVAIEAIAPWERVLDLQFARRPGDTPSWHLYVEIMGKYSNVILTGADNLIVAPAHQVGVQQSSIRPIQTGQPYEVPPALTATVPSLKESLERWQERVSLVPGQLRRQLLKNYRGLSPALVVSMIQVAGLDPDQSTDNLSNTDWEQLFSRWQEWLQSLEKSQFQPGWTTESYSVMPWGITEPVDTVQGLLNRYYTDWLNQQEFTALRHQLTQKISSILGKLRVKAATFEERLQQSDQADKYRQDADLLMAHLQNWEPGMKAIALADFDTGNLVNIPLDPEKNAVQNAQSLYKRHQKLKRARAAVEPLLQEVQAEINYLEQVEAALVQLDAYQVAEDLQTLEEIRDELIQQRYLEDPEQRSRNATDASTPYSYRSPSGFELLIGRNNRQNDQLSFRTAGDYDLWFHTQEIPGSHGLLRLEPGAIAEESDLQFAADLVSYYSRARQSDQVPVVYTEPKHVYKPKGAKPGMAIYKHERILWGRPPQACNYLREETSNKI
ncbi:NFACT family protein [Microcoleus sp. FACHB-831]|uniref:Rqc2 family fibronectin-binding protein n=1 Tax=Microcoleus sp. FACHB-831 TaxID=2692827 RepID=UPI001686A37F|nr:NFACT RNA binding domain-containing protein [Microcoleus sp. FACHB-831]MBD1923171.1 NFACT family protein [Microcoleus sp. FACHB-831]